MKVPSPLEGVKSAVLELMFPARCLGCGREGAFLCPPCLESLPRIVPPYCERCGIPLKEGRLCLNCQTTLSAIDGLRSLFPFQGIVQEAIHHLKYRNLKALAQPLGRLLADYLRDNPLTGELLVPVPLHPKHIRQRGYNQSALLAKEVGKRHNLPVEERALARTRNTPSQARTRSLEERRSNVQGAFRDEGQRLRGRAVILVDDVCTTGSTLNACAAALKEAGVTSVWGLTVAREI